MYPRRRGPEYGVFVRTARPARSRARGNEVDAGRAAKRTGAGGCVRPPRTRGCSRRTLSAARRARPDVVYAHYLVPTGLIAAAAGRPFVVTAHGGDVRNARSSLPLVGGLTRVVVRRARAVICVSEYVARAAAGAPRRRGDRLRRRHGPVPADAARPGRRRPGSSSSARLTERKNVGRLMRGVRATRRGLADDRRRRAARGRAAGRRARRRPVPRPASRRTGVLAALRERDVALPAEPRRAAGPGAAGGARVRPAGGRHQGRRPARVPDAGLRSAGRSA